MIDDLIERLRDRQQQANREAKFGVMPSRLYGQAAAALAQRDATILDLRERLAKAHPILAAIAAWEAEHGSAAVITPGEWEAFCKTVSKACVKGSARAALEPKP